MSYPFYHYIDHSRDVDPDPLTPLTFAGRMPNFPAKMHAILSRSDLSDIVAWLPHGRSWLVLKPREFESKVLPVYFKHSKFSSFVRQANGWGFRRVMQGHDRNSYYHPKFLRGLPHLCKTMKRMAKSQKEILQTGNEPDFYKISELFPVPDKPDDETMLLQSTLKEGPQARMPIYTGYSAFSIPSHQEKPVQSPLSVLASFSAENHQTSPTLGPEAATSLPASPSPAGTAVALHPVSVASNVDLTQASHGVELGTGAATQLPPALAFKQGPVLIEPNTGSSFSPVSAASSSSSPLMAPSSAPTIGPLACATMPNMPEVPFMPPGLAGLDPSAAAQFAAGFAWATVFSHQHMQSMMEQSSKAGGLALGQQQIQPNPADASRP